MNLLFWKHKTDGHVIKDNCLNKLPISAHRDYYQTIEQPTHYVDEDDDTTSILPIIAASELLSNDSGFSPVDSSSYDSGSDFGSSDTSSSTDFGGGDFGGGGSSDSF